MDRIQEILALLASPSGLSADELVDLEGELLSLFEAERAAETSDETIAALTGIRDGLALVRGEQSGRDAAAADVVAQAEALAAEIAPEPVEVVEEPELVAAAVRTPVGRRPVPAANRPRVPAQAARPVRVVTAAGRAIENDGDVVAALREVLDHGLQGHKDRYSTPFMSIRGQFSERSLTERDESRNGNVILAAALEARGEGAEAIVAAGGVCGPAAPYYEQWMQSSSARPVRDALLGFSGAGRGAVTFVAPPSLSSIGTSGGSPNQAIDVITNAEDVSGTAKPHQYMACGSPTTVTVDAVPSIVEMGNLMARTAPEQVVTWMGLVSAAHARVAEQNLLTQIGTASTAVTSTNGGGLGSTRDLLRDWARAAAGLRDRHRLAIDATIQLIAPRTVIDQMAADMAAGAFGPGDVDTFAITRQIIERWLVARNIAVAWSYEKASGALFTAQAADALRPWQTTVTAYVFPAGSFGFLDGGELNLGVVRDSTLNAANKFQMQTETFEAVLPIGVESLALTSTVCNSGGSMGTNDPDELCDDGGS